MQQGPAGVRNPRLGGVVFRIFLLAFLFTLLSFAVSLLGGIMVTALRGELGGQPFDMTIAYRHVALPVAVATAAITLVVAAVMEIRRYRQARVLAQLERSP